MTADLRAQLQASLGPAYTLERELGGGGMARVFVARETRLGRKVVVKFLDPDLAAVVSAQRFEREMRVAAALQDPRIVPVLAAGDANGIPFYTMPFVEGESLRARMTRGRLPLVECLTILRDVALALDYAHASGVVHRDIKPENILLAGLSPRRTEGSAGRVATAVVTDFGIAKALVAATGGRGLERDGTSDLSAEGRDVALPLTRTGVSLGTPAYMAPEQALGDGALDARADIYAWGVVAYELLSGAHPFGGRSSSQAMVAAHLSEAAVPLASRAPAVPPGIAAVVDQALRKDPAGRPPNAEALVRALEGVTTGGLGAGPTRAWSVRAVPRRLVMGSVAVGTLILLGITALLIRARAGASPEPPAGGVTDIRSLAVMPFSNVVSDTSTAYLTDGMADALTTALARLPQLRVVANRSAAATQRKDYNPRDAGKALEVDAVLAGSVSRIGDQLRIRAQLIRVADGQVVWGDSYDRTARNMFELEDDVTAAIAGELRGTLSGQATRVSSDALRGTSDQEAYDLYLRGRYAWSKRGERGLRTAIELFDAAIARDENFARAHAGLAMAWVVLPVFTSAVSADSALTMAQQSGSRALALDSSLADAHLAIAYAHKMKWRWGDAERHFSAATALAPEDATIRHWYGVHLYAVGDIPHALEQFERARTLDPFATTVATDGAIALYAARQLAEARAEIRRSLMLDSTRSDTWFIQGVIQLAQGRADSAVTSFETARRRGTAFDMRSYTSVALRRLGLDREADVAYAELRRDNDAGRGSPFDVAIAATAAGDTGTAMAAVQRIVDRRDMLVTEVSLPCDPLFDPLRANPGFERLLAGAGMRCRRP